MFCLHSDAMKELLARQHLVVIVYFGTSSHKALTFLDLLKSHQLKITIDLVILSFEIILASALKSNTLVKKKIS